MKYSDLFYRVNFEVLLVNNLDFVKIIILVIIYS